MSPLQWQVSGEKRPHAETWCYSCGNRAIGGVGADALVGRDVCVPEADCMVGNVLVGGSGFAVRCNGRAWSTGRGLPVAVRAALT